jgi:thiol-disulfide isomerase/thioredoxin
MFRLIKITLLLILAAAIELSLTVVRADLGFSFSLLIGYTIFFFIAYISMRLIKKLTPFLSIFSLFLGISAMHLPPRLIDFEGTLVSLPDYVFHVLGLLTAWLFYIAGPLKKWIPAGIGFAVALFMFYRGYSMWIHKLNFDTYSGYYSSEFPEFIAEGKTGNKISRDSLTRKLVLIDFWHTQCASCFRKFPILEEIYVKHRLNPMIKILALNLPLQTDQPTRAFDMIHKRGYSFPVAKLQTISIIDSLSISSFPTTILVNEDGRVIFKGSIENGITRLEREIKKKSE